MKIEIWNDFIVPHCYTGETLLVRAIDEMGLASRVNIILRAFELDPTFPKGKTIDTPHCVAKKYGCSLSEALEKIEAAASMARAAAITPGSSCSRCRVRLSDSRICRACLNPAKPKRQIAYLATPVTGQTAILAYSRLLRNGYATTDQGADKSRRPA